MFGGVWNKGCKRCRGDLLLERDEDGLYVSCLQCGAVDGDLTKLAQMRDVTQAVRERQRRMQRILVEVREPAR